MMTHFCLFDASCQVGRHMMLGPNEPHQVTDLLADLDHVGIVEALVIDSMSREFHPVDGNRRMVELLADEPRLHPAWSALPHAPEAEQLLGDELLSAMVRYGVGAIFLYPEQYRFNLSDWSVDRFLEPLAALSVPIFVNYNAVGHAPPDQTDWEAVVALCRRWPDLPVIVSESRIRRHNRTLYRALDACPNLRVELSALWLHRSIEFITENWGAERLIFGSQWPHHGHGDTVATLTTAEIADIDKQRIGGDNLRALLGWAGLRHPKVALPEPNDAYVAYGRSGIRPAELPNFADNHGHIGEHFCHYHIPNSTLDEVVADVRRYGIDKSVVFGYSGIVSDEQPGNDKVAAAVSAYPDLFVGFTMLNPHRGRDLMIAELERGKAMGLRGIKLIPTYQRYPETGPNIDIACEWANAHGMIMLNHEWGPPEQMERLVKTYPNVCFFTGHTTLKYAEIMRRYENLYVCSCPLLQPGLCEHVVATIGADRFMFGSDLEDLPIAWGLGPILFARIPAKEKQLILGDNLRRVLTQYGY